MSCGLTSCPDLVFPALDESNSASFDGFLQVMPPDDFDRAELQSIRDRARQLSIQGLPAKTMEERLYQQLADAADQLDAITARFEADVEDAFGTVTVTPTVEGCGNCPFGCCSSVHAPPQPPKVHQRHRPFLGGHRKPR